ncbi:MAG: hypothetical protein BA870_09775 [Desulfuromonadales bacterium C00003094]|jgi:hypothetical protein|nr:MAG: hypothetical protein BA870_09775 [Desulfuromonadales bacterium C00003094]OEU74185.1 MAG: hypothetical protein BA869_04080 [Desulfuromonadales bacterium C00003107]
MKFVTLLQKYCLCFCVTALLGMTLLPNAGVAQSTPVDTPEALAPSQQQVKTVVYYFHGNMRCASCRKIEAYTKEAIQSGFAKALQNGRLELQVINVDDSANEHYVQDFQLYTRSVVLERRAGNQQQQWKNLDQVWSLIRNKTAFMEYVQEQIQDMMKGA